MFSSSLTGLNIQYSGRACEDDDDWVSALDPSVRCSTLSPTDEKCHHIDTNGNTGYSSCTKACGNCFEDASTTENNTRDYNQPESLYSGESPEINDYESYNSQSNGDMSDLQDLVYRFTYEMNTKINELSDKIDGETDRIDTVEDEENLFRARGVCKKIVCKNKPPPEDTESDECIGVNCQELYLSECNSTDLNRSCCDFVTENDNVIEPTYNPDVLESSDCVDDEKYIWKPGINPENISEDGIFYQMLIRTESDRVLNPNTGGSSGGGSSGGVSTIHINKENNGEQPYNTTTDIAKHIDNVMYFEMNADIVSFKILEEHMPSSETDISYCYFSDIEVNTDIVEKTWSKYTTGDVDALPISNGNENYLVIKVSPPGTPRYDDDRIDDLYQDRQSLYYVFVNTGDTPPPVKGYTFYYKKDGQYKQYVDNSTQYFVETSEDIPNLYIRYDRKISSIMDGYNLSFKSSATEGDSIPLNIHENYSNIFSSKSTIKTLSPFFFELYSGNSFEINMDSSDYFLFHEDAVIFKRVRNSKCKEFDEIMEGFHLFPPSWNVLFTLTVVVFALSSIILVIKADHKSKFFYKFFPIILGIIIIFLSFEKRINESFDIIRYIIYLITVMMILYIRFGGADHTTSSAYPYLSEILGYLLFFLNLGSREMYNNKMKDPSDISECRVSGTKNSVPYTYITTFLIILFKGFIPTPPFALSAICSIFYIIIFAIQYINAFEHGDFYKINNIVLGFSNNKEDRLIRTIPNSVISNFRDILVMI